MNNPKYFICPISKNIVDAVIEINSSKFGLIPTRRQIDWNGGYVNGWDTKEFTNYVKSKSDNIVIGRDHGGEWQGITEDDGKVSYINDLDYFNIIHIDPWKFYSNQLLDGLISTEETIKLLYKLNPNVFYEIGTEETIKKFENVDLNRILKYLKTSLTNQEFSNIKYVVIQSGVAIDLVNRKNIGSFDKKRMQEMIDVVKSFDKKVKEHNGDYLSNEELSIRFDAGIDSINIGPEIAQIETDIYLQHMNKKEITEFYKICLESKKWIRWVNNVNDFDIKDELSLIKICGHYNYDKLPILNDITNIIKDTIKIKLNNLP
jgi:hypothetical protein